MKKIITILTTIFLLVGCESKYTENNKVDKAKGNNLYYELSSNPSTGFEWQYELSNDNMILTNDEYKTEEYDDPKTAPAGIEGTQYYSFKAIKEGNVTLTLKYLRSWESVKYYTLKYDIHIDKDLNITYDDNNKDKTRLLNIEIKN